MLAVPIRTHSDQRPSQPTPNLALCPEIPTSSSATAGAMISIMPTPRPLTPKRPKLSLQTSTISTLPASKQSRTALSNLSNAVNSPTTYRNTYENAFEPDPSTPVSSKPLPDEAFTQIRPVQRPSPQTSLSTSSISTVSSGSNSPFASAAPYIVALGARSILRNSPLPRRHTTHLSNRPAKRMFHPAKRVSFPETLVEMIPTPVLSESDVSIEDPVTDEGFSKDLSAGFKPKRMDEIDNVPSPSSGPGRRKRRSRDWISRPIEDDASPTLAKEHSFPSTTSSTSDTTSSKISLPILLEEGEVHDSLQQRNEHPEDPR
ncbi:MAG: hypothetical protein L6R38_005348 [Xanthoria sp. 2 TBL-2021]|nr:MAG: hypothetical protein L6R38_005348 [Xanthoria sp. 2 TBL-2021]